MNMQTPEVNNSVEHAAAENLAFLLSVIRSGETLHPDEEQHVRDTIKRLGVLDKVGRDLQSVRALEGLLEAVNREGQKAKAKSKET